MANIRITELDFDQIKENLRTYLRNQSQFTDFDFEGSNLSVLLDLLAYNTHYNAVLANMVNNEMFLDSAIKRSSVVSLGKHLSYTPRSVRSSVSIVDVALSGVSGTPSYVTLEPYTQFTTSADGQTLSFYNITGYTATPVDGVYTFENIKLYQGRRLEYFWTVQVNNSPSVKYQLPNKNVDTSTLRVSVQYAAGYSETFTLMNNVVDANANSKVYYLQENPLGYYEIYFGDGILGFNPSAGDIVKIDYLISDGAAGNVSTNAPISWSTNVIANESSRVINTVSYPQGGADAESIEQVRFNALNTYSAAGRAITATDYSSILLSEIPGAQSINVWGGENNIPPVYGKVFISIKPKDGYVLTDGEKSRIIEDVLKPRAMITTRHEFVEPTYIYLNFSVMVKYVPSRTNRSNTQISTLVYDKVESFITTNLERFNAPYYSSQLQAEIAALDDSIVSVIVVNKLQSRIAAQAGATYSGNIAFPGKIHPNELRSSNFAYQTDTNIYTVQIRDVPDQVPYNYDGTGTLKLYDVNTGAVLIGNVGTVNYATGEVSLANITPTGYIGGITDLRITVELQESSRDVKPTTNEIILLDDTAADTIANVDNGITISVEPVQL